MRKLISLVALLLAATQDGQQAVAIPIQNSSFEQGSAGWEFGSGSGTMTRTGGNSAYAGYGSTFSQDLDISPAVIQKPSPGWPYVTEGFYVLKFSVANYFPSYPGYYEAKIYFGTQELCETSGWGARNSTQVTLTCPASGYLIIDKSLPDGGPVQGANNVVIQFSVNGWTLLFDDISLTFTPD